MRLVYRGFEMRLRSGGNYRGGLSPREGGLEGGERGVRGRREGFCRCRLVEGLELSLLSWARGFGFTRGVGVRLFLRWGEI